MKTGIFARLAAASIILAVCLSLASMLLLIRLADSAESRHRENSLLYLADKVEVNVKPYTQNELKSAEVQNDLRAKLQPRHSGPERNRPHGQAASRGGNFWLINEDGDVIFGSSDRSPFEEKPWAAMTKPRLMHEIASEQDFFRLFPSYFIVRLDLEPNLYLVTKDEHRVFMRSLFQTQAAITFASIFLALILAFFITVRYLKRKATEARQVFHQLETGNLKARFEIKRFDEFGELLVSFNRMATEIERLVNRIHSTERSRKHLLQELGHDLRTPLTSLRTSFENIRLHHAKINDEQRRDLHEMIGAEINYISDLFENLMTIASIDEPHYKNETDLVDVYELLKAEVTNRQNLHPSLKWHLTADDEAAHAKTIGDPHLLNRLFRNAFDNAGRYAQSTVLVTCVRFGDELKIQILDDGPGLSQVELGSFARRREQRTRREGKELNFSLGLGSVIMKSIVELHGGHLEIKNRSARDEASDAPSPSVTGAELTVLLPVA